MKVLLVQQGVQVSVAEKTPGFDACSGGEERGRGAVEVVQTTGFCLHPSNNYTHNNNNNNNKHNNITSVNHNQHNTHDNCGWYSEQSNEEVMGFTKEEYN